MGAKKRKNKEPTPTKKSYREILRLQIREGKGELTRPKEGLFISSLSGGLDIGFSVLLMATVLSLTAGVFPSAVVDILVACMFPIGFIFVLLGRSELFTEHTTLAVIPVLDGKSTLRSLLRLWAIIWVGNIIGAAIFAFILAYIGPKLGVIDPQSFYEIASKLTNHPWETIVISATLAGWMKGLLSWLITASKDTIGQISIIFLITFAIGITGLHHSIVGTAEVLTSLFAGQPTSIQDFIHFLTFTTLGNIFGGTVFVAFFKYRHASLSTKK